MSKIVPCLWCDNNAEEMMNYYLGVFKDSKSISTSPVVCEMELDGQRFRLLNGGPDFKYNEAVSFYIDCKDQEEIDYYWNKLIGDGGEESMCGWLKDKYGLSWQVAPENFGELLFGPDQDGSKRAMDCMMKMHKIEIQKIKDAYEGK